MQLGLFGAPRVSIGAAPVEPSPAPPPVEPPPVEPRETRWVICPARATGSMDAEHVTLAGWEGPARAMAARERLGVGLYLIEDSGAWTLRHRMDPDGTVQR